MLHIARLKNSRRPGRKPGNYLPVAGLAAGIAAAWLATLSVGGAAMMDPALDDPQAEWCYLAKSTTVIGVPYQPDVTQITYDGAVFTRHAELCFFHGSNDVPLLARSKTFLEGWIPVVQFAWQAGGIGYDIEYFAFPLEGEAEENTVNFVQVRMHNGGAQLAGGKWTAALRHSGRDYRNGGVAFSPAWRYEMTDAASFRDGKLVCAFPPGASREAVPGVAYEKPFAGFEQSLTARAECCLVRYQRPLRPGETFAATFKMPRIPVPGSNTVFLAKLARADYGAYRARTIRYWREKLAGCAEFEFPERRVQDAHRASLVHLLLGTRSQNGRRMQTDGLPYPDFFLTSVPEVTMHCLTSGYLEHPKERLIPDSLAQQQADGLYFDRAVSQGRIIPATQGHILYSIAMTVLFTQDQALARKIYPSLRQAVAFVENSVRTNQYGLLPRCWPYDAEMIDGHYTGQNLFALMGVRCAVRVARFLGEARDASAWTDLAHAYEASLRKAIDASAKPNGYVPTGLYDFLSGPAAPRGFPDYGCNSDWENMLLACPTEVLAPGDPRVRGTLNQVRQGYAEGIMTYRHGQHLHQYITSNMIEQYAAMGDAFTAWKDFYHQLLHSGSTHESFENLVVPWTDRQVDPGCPPPHVWGTSKQGLMVRNLVLMEYGGRCGLEPDRRELWLFHCLSPAWVKPGARVSLKNAPTEFGLVEAVMNFEPESATVTLSGRFHTPPAAVRLRVPWFKELVRFTTDARTQRREGDSLLVSPDATRITLEWKDRPGAHEGTLAAILTDYRSANRFAGIDKQGRPIIQPGQPFLLPDEKRPGPQPLSFALVREAFLHEYGRLARESVEKGGQLQKVTAPALLTAEERQRRFAAEHGSFSIIKNLATGCAVEASASLPDHGPELATDGNLSLDSSWQADPWPQWLKVDLGKVRRLKGVHVWTYWGNGRYYQYTVEVSADGRDWFLAGDQRGNVQPATAAGDAFGFAPREVRYIRVNLLFHSLNPGAHIVEVGATAAD